MQNCKSGDVAAKILIEAQKFPVFTPRNFLRSGNFRDLVPEIACPPLAGEQFLGASREQPEKPRALARRGSFFLAITFIFLLFLNDALAEDKGYLENQSQTNLSAQEIKHNISLLYKQAKMAYKDGDIETAKELFYNILELKPEHRGANRYIDYEIPRKIIKLKYRGLKNKSVVLGKREEQTVTKQEKALEEIKDEVRQIEDELKVKEIDKELVKIESQKQNNKELRSKQRQAKLDETRQRIELRKKERQETKEEQRYSKREKREEKLEKKQDKIKAIEKRKSEIKGLKEENKQGKILAKQKRIEDVQQVKKELKHKKEEERSTRLEAKRINAKEIKIKEKNAWRNKQLPILEKLHQNSIHAAQKGKKAQIQSLYQEGFYAYQIAEFDKAREAFARILELDASHIKARDQINIYIPKAEKRMQKQY